MTEIKKIKLMVELTIYPGGQCFPKIFVVGQQRQVQKQFIEKKKQRAEQEKQKKLEAEKYTIGTTIEM